MDKLIKSSVILSSLTTTNILIEANSANAVKGKKKNVYKDWEKFRKIENLKRKLYNLQINVEINDIRSIYNNIYDFKNGKCSFIKDDNYKKLTNFNKIAENFGNKQFTIIFFEDGSNDVYDKIYNENDKDNELTKLILELKNKNKTFYVLSFTGSEFIGFDYSTEKEKELSNSIINKIVNPEVKHQKEKPEGEKPEGEKPEGEKPEKEKPEGEKPEKEKPEGEKPEEQQKPEEKQKLVLQQEEKTLMDKLMDLKQGEFNFVISNDDENAIVDKENEIITENEGMREINIEDVKALFTYCASKLIDFTNFKDNYLETKEKYNENLKYGCFNSYIFKINSVDGNEIKLTLINEDYNENTILDFSKGEIYISFLRNIMFPKIEKGNFIEVVKENDNKEIHFRFLLIDNEKGYEKFKELDKKTDELIIAKQKDKQEDNNHGHIELINS